MQKMWIKAAAAIAMTGLTAIGVQAQDKNAAAKNSAGAPSLDFSAAFFKTFSTATKGNGTAQKPLDSYGGMIGMRYMRSPLVGLELSYSLSPLDQKFSVDPGTCNYTCANQPLTIPSKMSEVGVDWVASKRSGELRPFGLGGIGIVIAPGSGSYYQLNTIVRLGYTYGGGVDWGTEKFGLRAQYRGTFYKAPALTFTYFPTGKFTQTAEPMVGIYYRRRLVHRFNSHWRTEPQARGTAG